jgi:hypothetical protein
MVAGRSLDGLNVSEAFSFSSHAMQTGLPAAYKSVSAPQLEHAATVQNYTQIRFGRK